MKEEFRKFLVNRGYRETTPSGHPSTVYDYIKRIDKVCEWEQVDWLILAADIDLVVLQYAEGGIKEDLGHKSHNAVINALRRFQEFVHSVKNVSRQLTK